MSPPKTQCISPLYVSANNFFYFVIIIVIIIKIKIIIIIVAFFKNIK